MDRSTSQRIYAARGTVLGLVLGSSVGALAGNVPDDEPLQATSGGQLACFTVDGLIRADVRLSHKGICYHPGVVWHAYHRWATAQRIAGIKPWSDENWPDGWLVHVPVLAQRRGSAPATVAALQGKKSGTIEEPVGSSIGAHAVVRSLPAALLPDEVDRAGQLAAEIAALTHCGEAVDAAAVGTMMIHQVSRGRGIADAAALAERQWPAAAGKSLALAAAQAPAAQPAVLSQLASDARATSALAGGVYAAMSFPEPERVRDALLFAASAGDGGHAAAVAGTLLGAMHGPNALPVDWLSRLELAWAADTLAQDFVRQITENPSGNLYGEADDPHWSDRYPGW
ncbi:ADP-ribosylglycohydrolase family protein [Catellatospora bangladeshensis]|uniref:ADP-ribosylglycohydrolase n=1 Tax=Catellatospora bangladeshensis TaxID=310355 RepID=A0A8J3JVN4_9ACTN|nr:ADP-ribosylglycohydrolase family protein [Catellatospora bangladeshensis]GIF85893.1 ADP-ribosylglycohydrolase [Catellatospora bangladeshensis]